MSQPPYPPNDGPQWNPPPGQYGQPGQYGSAPGQYGQPGQYGPPGQYGGPPPGGSGNGKVIGIVAGVVVLVAAVVLVLVFSVFKGDDESSQADSALAQATALASQLSDAAAGGQGSGGDAPAPGPLVDATAEPDGLGDDAALDALAQGCFDGDMQNCDDLFLQSDYGSDYETYGDTCAGRQPAGTGQFCTLSFPDA